jgi:hypothetical protein
MHSAFILMLMICRRSLQRPKQRRLHQLRSQPRATTKKTTTRGRVSLGKKPFDSPYWRSSRRSRSPRRTINFYIDDVSCFQFPYCTCRQNIYHIFPTQLRVLCSSRAASMEGAVIDFKRRAEIISEEHRETHKVLPNREQEPEFSASRSQENRPISRLLGMKKSP